MEVNTLNKTKVDLLRGLTNLFGRAVTPQLLSDIRQKLGDDIAAEFQKESFYDERMKRWVRASIRSARFEHFLTVHVQGLGRVDCNLIREDEQFRDLPDKQKQSIQVSMLLTERFTLSHLWVLGAYEIVRTVHQRARRKALLNSDELRQLQSLKNSFARLRMPLAKLEAARNHKATDSPIAYASLHRDLGIAWQLTPTFFVTRRELSDSFLDFFENLK
jgi:hypothetical protein